MKNYILISSLPVTLALSCGSGGGSGGSFGAASGGGGFAAVGNVTASSGVTGGGGTTAGAGGSTATGGSGGGATGTGGAAASCAPQQMALGTAQRDGKTCAAGTGSECFELTVSCPSVVDVHVQLRITPAATGVANRGTVVFGTGGPGQGFYGSDYGLSAANMLSGLAADGFQVIERSWVEGWIAGQTSMLASSCRYATLIRWIYDNLHDQSTALCASGNSGGSSEVSYALSRWNQETILDLAVPTGGPPMGRMDIGCADPTDPMVIECENRLLPAGHNCTSLGCLYSRQGTTIDSAYSDTPCANRELDRLLCDSVVSPNGDFDYPQTKVHFVYGANDCGGGPGLGYYHYDAIVSDKELTIAANTPHAVPSTSEGATAIQQAIENGCVMRHM